MQIKLLIVSFIFLSFPVHSQNNPIEKKIIDTIFKLKEVKQEADHVEKATKGKRHLGLVIYEKPSKNDPYYWVKAWEDNCSNYVTHFDFFVYTNPFEIKFYDTIEDTAISLKEWRRQMKNQNLN